MKKLLTFLFLMFLGNMLFAQQEFHVFPVNDKNSPGTSAGNGSLQLPWDLQTALSQNSDIVNGGDIIWLHEGVYNGRFISTLKGTKSNHFVTVSTYKEDKVVLNGNINSNKKYVLEVKGENVIYKNFEVTFLGDFSRNKNDENFQVVDGIGHVLGEDCKFINLKIHNNPGNGFGSWKATGGTHIEDCMIYNNGYVTNSRGAGVGMYVQNMSDKTRVISNNIIFNNYYKGVEVWSANKNATNSYVQNVTLLSNAIFNNGSPANAFKDNLIVASDDRNGINIAKNITIKDNVFYHNTDVANGQIGGDAAALTIGFHEKAPVENVVISSNIIIGRNNSLRLLHAKTLTFTDNLVYCGYVHLDKSILRHNLKWNFNNNNYYSKKSVAFRIIHDKDYTLKDWQSKFSIDKNSNKLSIKNFETLPVLNIKPTNKEHTFKVVVLNKEGTDVTVDFSKYNIKKGLTYKIYDAENRNVIAKSGIISEDLKVIFPMQLKDFEKPLHNASAQKTFSNFGVFIIEFETQQTEVKKKVSVIKRFFNWLGF